jgi:hypothetical protein
VSWPSVVTRSGITPVTAFADPKKRQHPRAQPATVAPMRKSGAPPFANWRAKTWCQQSWRWRPSSDRTTHRPGRRAADGIARPTDLARPARRTGRHIVAGHLRFASPSDRRCPPARASQSAPHVPAWRRTWPACSPSTSIQRFRPFRSLQSALNSIRQVLTHGRRTTWQRKRVASPDQLAVR